MMQLTARAEVQVTGTDYTELLNAATSKARELLGAGRADNCTIDMQIAWVGRCWVADVDIRYPHPEF